MERSLARSGRSGLATVFPQPIGMAASFEPDAIHTIYTAVSDEVPPKCRILGGGELRTVSRPDHVDTHRQYLSRSQMGRGIETYGEDPYLTSVMGVNVVKGLQCMDANQKYDKIHACAKHFAVHSGPEWNRHEFNAENIKPRDLHETILYLSKH